MFNFLSIIDLGYSPCLFYKLEDQLNDLLHLSQMMVERTPIQMDHLHLLET